MTLLMPSLRSSLDFLSSTNACHPSSSSGRFSTTSEKSERKYWLIGVYLPVIDLKTSWEAIPPYRAQIGPKWPEHVMLNNLRYLISSSLNSGFVFLTYSISSSASSLLL